MGGWGAGLGVGGLGNPFREQITDFIALKTDVGVDPGTGNLVARNGSFKVVDDFEITAFTKKREGN